jgi:hypothetical protein
MKTLAESKETKPKEKWESAEEYILYLKQFAAYKFAERFIEAVQQLPNNQQIIFPA